MRIHVLSDLHLEFAGFTPPPNDADVVVLAGDIGLGVRGLEWAAETFAVPDVPVIYVPGNHEYYKSDRRLTLSRLRERADQLGFRLLDNDAVEFRDLRSGTPVRFLGTTLWTDFKLFGDSYQSACMREAQRGLNDFRLIREGSHKFTAANSLELHKMSRAWLETALQTPRTGVTVVVTHHLPSACSVAERYKNDLLSACFASELSALFGPMSLWIHGHAHESLDYEMAGTRVLCNPRGYVGITGVAENSDFNPNLVVEV
ncbi:MAG: metallophosphoesterase [Rhodocyclaceae bacterium]|nr:metallophosphoesterase [Rhodocyclaceae bacterium]MDZ4216310.1 metallophosphoesterase [Rhodocyclaceae bacterium]